MSGRDDEFDAQLADSGDDRPGLDDLVDNDYSALGLDDDSDDDFDDDDDDTDDGDDFDDDDDDDDDDFPDDATDEEIDLVGAFYREDGNAAGMELPKDLANDLEELIATLRRVPGDAGALGAVAIDSDVFVLVRVRGKHVQVLLSDVAAASDWPIAHDVADLLGVDIPEDDDDGGPIGDMDMLADAGVSEFDLEALCSDLDAEPLDVVEAILERLGFASQFEKVAATFGV